MANDNSAKKISLDLTRLEKKYEIEGITKHIKDTSKVSVILDYNNIDSLDITNHNAYNLYGYSNNIKDNSATESKVNYSGDIARTIILKNKSKNRYFDYKYAYHYPLGKANYTKFSRYYNRRDYTDLFFLNDFYSFLSFFDKTIHPYYYIFSFLDNSEYSDFYSIRSNADKDVINPISYHGRDIYMDANILYLKIESKVNFYREYKSPIRPYKYMIIELSGKYNDNIKLDSLFSLCKKHAYILNDTNNKLAIIDLTNLLAGCKATKFGDPNDSRTLLDISDVYVMTGFCSDSNIEDLSMHTIRLIDSKDKTLYLTSSFANSKIRKLPKGLVESFRTGGYSTIYASYMFINSKDIEMDISKINIPTLGSSPSTYNLNHMYDQSNCRHINRSIISRNDRDEIQADGMYMGTTLIEDTPLPDGMFKNYRNFDKIFDGVTFETANTFKYIYGEFAKTEIKYESSGSKKTPQINNINIINNIKDYKIIIGSGEDYEKTNLIPFTIYPDNITGSEMIRLSILGNKREDIESSNSKKLYAVGRPCKELSFGFRMDDLKRAANIGYKQYTSDKYFITNDDFKYHFIRNDIESLKPDFFSVIAKPIDVQVFRRLSILLYGDDYYNRFNYIFDGAFRDRSSSQSGRDEYKITSVLYSNTLKSTNMISLDEIISKNLLSPIIQRRFDNACAIINTNGKNLKWTLSEYHYNTHNRMEDIFGARTSYGVPHFYNYISVFTNAVYLYRAINAQMYFTKDFSAEKIEFIFRANDQLNLVRFLALMSLYMDPNDPKKPVGRFILIHNGNIYDSKTNMGRINALATFNQSHIDEIKTNVDEYDDGFLVRGEV